MASPPTADDVALARAAASRPLEGVSPAVVERPARADWTAGVVEEGGQFHRVLVLPGAGALRMARDAQTAAWLPPNMALVQALATTARLPVAVPVPLTEVVASADGTAGVVQKRVRLLRKTLPRVQRAVDALATWRDGGRAVPRPSAVPPGGCPSSPWSCNTLRRPA